MLEEIEEMLRARAERGNAQSKHGSKAAYQFEVFELIRLLDESLTEQTKRNSWPRK